MLNTIVICGQAVSLALFLYGAYLSITNSGSFRTRVRLRKIRPAGGADLSHLRSSYPRVTAVLRKIGPAGRSPSGEGPATTASA